MNSIENVTKQNARTEIDLWLLEIARQMNVAFLVFCRMKKYIVKQFLYVSLLIFELIYELLIFEPWNYIHKLIISLFRNVHQIRPIFDSARRYCNEENYKH